MSRFSVLHRQLGFIEALSIYRKVKFQNSQGLRLSNLREPFSLRSNPYDYATFEEVLLRREYDIELSFEPKNIIDAGANIGLTALFFANKYPGAVIVSLEPDDDNFKLLSQNISAYKNIVPLKGGLWSKDAFLEIVDEGVGNNAFRVEEVGADHHRAISAYGLPTIMKLQAWEHIDLLKIDIEGSEKNLFENNFADWLPKVRVLIIELHDRMVPGSSKAVFSAINNYDFSVDIRGENFVFVNNDF
ncbi:MAG: FkbM family methyltransferase [Sphingobacteriales bacterium]|nr:MAG: FkbM family methyltransferase [Sphingobacteriales bacterium]